MAEKQTEYEWEQSREQRLKHELGLEGLTVYMVGFVFLFVAWAGLKACSRNTNVDIQPEGASGTSIPANAEVITFLTNDTKAEWVYTVTEKFNAAGHQTAEGKQIFVLVEQLSSGDVTELFESGELRPTVWSPGTISWVDEANIAWQDLHGRPLVAEDCPPLVYTAIGFGMWRPMAEAMGWPDTPIGWDEIVSLAADPAGWERYGVSDWGQFKFGHTHPGSSNTGFLAMTSLAYNTLDITEGLTPELARSQPVLDAFQEIEQHTYHYGLSTRSLFTTMARRGPSYLHAGTNSEIGVLATNFYQEDVLRHPLVFIAPKEGTFWSENPYCLLDVEWVTAEQREAAIIYRDYLLGREAQEIALDEWLRPADPAIPLRSPIDLEHGTDPRITPATVPGLASVSGETAAAIQDVFMATKKRATILVLLDISGSMGGGKIEAAVAGLQQFIQSLHQDDEILVYTFSDNVVFLRPSGRVGDIGEELSQVVGQLSSAGDTALYDSICQGLGVMSARQEQDRQTETNNRLYGIVLLSDGQDRGSEVSQAQMMACLPSGEDAAGIKIFTVAYGDNASEELLATIAEQTNGKAFQSDPGNIEQVYLEISFEQ